jgi:hypothetical protein
LASKENPNCCRNKRQGPFPLKKDFHGPKIFQNSLLKVEIFNFKILSDTANHILQFFLSAENFLEWKWTFTLEKQEMPVLKINALID